MANSPFKQKNLLGNNMAQDNKSKGSGSTGASMFGQGFVPGGKQAPYWQTQDMGAAIPQGKPAWMTQGMKQQAISGDGDYAGWYTDPEGETGQGTVIPAPAPGKYTLPDGSTTDSQYQYELAWQAYNAPTSGKAEDILAGQAGGVDSTKMGSTGTPQGYQAGKTTNPYMDQTQALYDQIFGSQGTDWQQQQNAAMAELQRQGSIQQLNLQNALAASGVGAGVSGAYAGGLGQLALNQQLAQGGVLAEIQKGQAAEELAKYQLLAQLGAQMGDMYGQQQMIEQSRKQAWIDNMMNLANETFADLNANNMVLGEDPYAEAYFAEKMGMSYADYKAMMQQAFTA